MKIAVVAPSLRSLGGQAVQADELIRALVRVGHEAFLIPTNPKLPGPLGWLSRVKFLRTFVNQAAYGVLLLRDLPRAEVVHVFSASYFSFLLAPVPALIAARIFKRSSVLNYHSGEAAAHLQRWHRMVRPFLGMADVVVVPSQYLGSVFQEFGVPAQVIPNIIDLDRFTYRPRIPLRPRFITTRNLEPLYDVANTLRAFSQVLARYPEARLDVVGSGSLMEPLRRLASELQLTGVKFSGRVERDEIPSHYAEADIFLNSSRIDNQPISILEAFASGLPVVSTNAGGIPNLVEDGRTGLLVEKGKPHRMADKIIGLLESPEMGMDLARNAREACQCFRWDKVAAAFEAVYRGDQATPTKKQTV